MTPLEILDQGGKESDEALVALKAQWVREDAERAAWRKEELERHAQGVRDRDAAREAMLVADGAEPTPVRLAREKAVADEAARVKHAEVVRLATIEAQRKTEADARRKQEEDAKRQREEMARQASYQSAQINYSGASGA